jgi:molybdenum cofactor cytidylyltransferase
VSAAGICTVMLAAGESVRFGGIKLLQPIDGVSMLRRAVLAALDCCDELLVVTGANADALTAELQGLPVHRVHNPDWTLGMGSSIGCAFRALNAKPSPPAAAVICLADQVRVGAPQLRALIAQHLRTPNDIVAALHQDTTHPADVAGGDRFDRVGPPCVFPQADFATLAALGGHAGAKQVLRRNAARLRTVAMPEAAIDIDTVADYQRIRSGTPDRWLR